MGRLTKLERAFLNKPWAKVRDGVQVKRLATEEDLYVLAQSDARIDKQRGMRRKRLRHTATTGALPAAFQPHGG